MHITQPGRARGDGPATLPRRTLRLGFSKRRRDALAEPRVLFCLRRGAALSEFRDSFFHERSVAAELSQKRRAHALDVVQTDALARRGHHGFSQRPAFRARAAHRRALVARAAFADAFGHGLLAATPDAREEFCMDLSARAQL